MIWKKQSKNVFITSLTLFLLLLGIESYSLWGSKIKQLSTRQTTVNSQATVQLTHIKPSSATESPAPVDHAAHAESLTFVYAAQKATPAVVHITAKYESKVMRRGTSPLEELFKDFLGEGFELGPKEYRTQPGAAFGSGVIIGGDGYIVTNNHVIEKADTIEVTLDDNRRYIAKVVGADPDTDLALLKIEEKNYLPYLEFGNSDKLQIGEGVLAVGNPFNLTSTVTAGIVSAKARRAEISKSGSGIKIEAFIQTDAAVNRGNSGGALVNLKGELVGITTAISTPTGAFAGYSFAIPSSIVQRIISDLKKDGTVQRAILGIYVQDVNADLVKEKKLEKLNKIEGVYVSGFTERSAAAEAEIKEGDIITAINDTSIKNLAQLHEQLTKYQPGDKVTITINRKGTQQLKHVTLKGALNEVKIVQKQGSIEVEGATFEPIDSIIKQKLGIKGGVQIKALKSGKWQQAGIKKEFIVVAIDKEPVDNLEDLARILKSKKGGILIEGVYPASKDGKKDYYGIGW